MNQRSSYLQLFLNHRTALINYAAPIVGCRSRAEDVVQEAYIRFSTRGEDDRTGERIANPVGYLYRIVRNLAVDWARRFSIEAPLPDPEQLNRIPAAIPTAKDTVIYRDKLRVLAEALAELPERTQIAFAMHRHHKHVRS